MDRPRFPCSPQPWLRPIRIPQSARGLGASTPLNGNVAGGVFHAIGDLLVLGSTGTTVNDFRAILVMG